MPRLTKIGIEKMRPALKRREVADSGCVGLYLVVQPSGRKSWAVRTRLRGGKPIKLVLGPAPAISIAKARKAAEAVIERARAGEDPRASGKLTRDVVEQWFIRDQSSNRSVAQVRREFDREVLPRIGSTPIDEVTRRDVRAMIERVADRGSPTAARRLHAHLNRFFRWSVGSDYMDANPIADLPKAGSENPRDHVLTDNELGLFWRTSAELGYPFGPAFRLLLLTAARRDEIVSLAWSEIEFDGDEPAINLPGTRTKNTRAHMIPLTDAAVDLIRTIPRLALDDDENSPLVFTTTGRTAASGISKAKARLDEMMVMRARKDADESGRRPVEVAPWRLHDLRRTAATRMAELGVEPHVVEAVLNHVSGFRAGVAGVYNRAAYAKEKRTALDIWAKYLTGLAG